ncbi:hypothetical protein CDAR_321071 [Caerostris darwini]|uniref:Uncharacterized protein n=1 Tax=Caerostris darwini TaxID=1538125 RepID=A0AAV4WYQ8_9ARAC|nr:hypothetical protein CDAR_321071 [Caerostris darwini]
MGQGSRMESGGSDATGKLEGRYIMVGLRRHLHLIHDYRLEFLAPGNRDTSVLFFIKKKTFKRYRYFDDYQQYSSSLCRVWIGMFFR